MHTDPVTKINYDQLHRAVDAFNDGTGIAADMEVLADLLNAWLYKSVGADPQDTLDPVRTYRIRDYHLNMIFATTQLMVKTARIKEAWRVVKAYEEGTSTDPAAT